jgi:hypothetical protein
MLFTVQIHPILNWYDIFGQLESLLTYSAQIGQFLHKKLHGGDTFGCITQEPIEIFVFCKNVLTEDKVLYKTTRQHISIAATVTPGKFVECRFLSRN